VKKQGAAFTAEIDTKGLTRVDVYVDERPERSLDVSDGRISVVLGPRPAAPKEIRVEGFRQAERVAVRRAAIG
jgi:hypothetical protein